MEAVGQVEPQVERRIVVRGRVQGVGYRWFARETATALGVAGWARNMPDGSVVLEVAAPTEVLNRLADQLRVGPRGARVAQLTMSERAERAPLPNPFVIIG